MEVTMATKITVVLEDDLDGGPADETVRFGIGGTDYKIDLNAKNAAIFRQQLAPYLEHACKAGRGQRQRPWRTTASRERRADIQAWAKDQGIALSGRARIPPALSSSTKPPWDNPDQALITVGLVLSPPRRPSLGR
jgi:hypothetical protein